MSDAESQKNEKLAAEFPASTHEEWKAAAEKLLKGAPFDKIMLTATPENITLQPIYERDVLGALPTTDTFPGQDGYLRGTTAAGYLKAPWDIAQEIHFSDPAAFNTALLHDLESGLNAVSIDLTGPAPLRLEKPADIVSAFNKVIPDALRWHFHAGERTPDIIKLFYSWLVAHNGKTDKVQGSFNYDPLGTLAATGSLANPLQRTREKEGIYDKLAFAVKIAGANLPLFTSVGVNTRAYHNAGASATEELGAALATGVEYLRELAARGVDISTAASKTAFHFAIGGNFFVELAKLRAARILWARVVAELGGNEEAQAMHQHARTGLFNKTRHDPYVNILRTTTEALGGVLGGVESLTVGTFDEVIRVPEEFSRRIARNTQVILQEECELTSVIDPAGGSWYVEKLTDDIARKAWEFFQQIEEKGGAAAALQAGFIQETIATTRKGREKLLGQRRHSLIGTNQYPNVTESPLSGNPLQDSPAQASKDTSGVVARALPSTRLAAPYEALRAASSAYKQQHGHGPKIHLANIAALRRHKARADFTRGFFETGGFEITGAEGSTDDALIASKAVASGAKIVVICGHDEDYPIHVPAIARAIKAQAPSVIVLLAGNPGDNEASYKEAGLDSFIFVKSDNYATNRQYLQKVGAIPA
ncbi:MAG: methylmalonyl-CoA mutase subunit beta [Puniceicoccales bacterium]|jgi:methylmalonyl-CoA mutase|nr:methylmalonyl-CoA mutase subunit beta [Puniceicoccales bacterium]